MFKSAFVRTGTLSTASQQLVWYIQWLNEETASVRRSCPSSSPSVLFSVRSMLTYLAVQQRRTPQISQSAPRSILTPLEQRVIDKIEELKLEDKSFEEQEEAMSLVLSAVSRSLIPTTGHARS